MVGNAVAGQVVHTNIISFIYSYEFYFSFFIPSYQLNRSKLFIHFLSRQQSIIEGDIWVMRRLTWGGGEMKLPNSWSSFNSSASSRYWTILAQHIIYALRWHIFSVVCNKLLYSLLIPLLFYLFKRFIFGHT